MNPATDIESATLPKGVEDAEKRHHLVLFDGVCNLCNGWVQFVIKRDPGGVFHFAALQSEAARTAMSGYALPPGTDSIVLVRDGRVFTRSGAVLRILAGLRQPWPLLSVLRVIPPFVRDFAYDWVAKNRYRWFGRRDQCMIPTADLRRRFLD